MGSAHQAGIVLKYIRAAESGDARIFRNMTGRSAETTFLPPTVGDVDRTDEGCVLASLDAALRMVSVIWTCRSNSKQNAQRMFLIEAGHVTHMWNDWAEQPLVLPPNNASKPNRRWLGDVA